MQVLQITEKKIPKQAKQKSRKVELKLKQKEKQIKKWKNKETYGLRKTEKYYQNGKIVKLLTNANLKAETEELTSPN